MQFAEGNAALVQEYKDSFQAVTDRATDILRKILNIHIIEFE